MHRFRRRRRPDPPHPHAVPQPRPSPRAVPYVHISPVASFEQTTQDHSAARLSPQPHSTTTAAAPAPSPASAPASALAPSPSSMSSVRRELLRRRAAERQAAAEAEAPLHAPLLPNVPLPRQPQNALERKPSSPAVEGYVPDDLTSYGAPLRRRKALLIGIGYRDNAHLEYLPGCTNDVRQMFTLLTSDLFAFPQHSINVLSDEIVTIGDVVAEAPTRINIVRNMAWLTADLCHGDSVVFFFAGHGDFVEDKSGDEIETGYDQCIMPVDYKREPKHINGSVTFKGVPPILDDTIYERLVRSVPSGAKVTAIVDACRSGTAFDLPVMYSDHGPRYRKSGSDPPRKTAQPHKPAGACVLFSGSADHQMSADMTVPRNGVDGEQESFGIMTRSFTDAVREMVANRDPCSYAGVEPWTYGQFFDRVKALVYQRVSMVLPEGFEAQEPQLSSSHNVKIWETPFTM